MPSNLAICLVGLTLSQQIKNVSLKQRKLCFLYWVAQDTMKKATIVKTIVAFLSSFHRTKAVFD